MTVRRIFKVVMRWLTQNLGRSRTFCPVTCQVYVSSVLLAQNCKVLLFFKEKCTYKPVFEGQWQSLEGELGQVPQQHTSKYRTAVQGEHIERFWCEVQRSQELQVSTTTQEEHGGRRRKHCGARLVRSASSEAWAQWQTAGANYLFRQPQAVQIYCR